MSAAVITMSHTSVAPAKNMIYPTHYSLEDIRPFVHWLKRFESQHVVGYSNDAFDDPLATYLQQVWAAPRPFVTCDYWMSDRSFPQYGIVQETPLWASRLVYMLDVFGESVTLTAGQVLLMMRAAELLDSDYEPFLV